MGGGSLLLKQEQNPRYKEVEITIKYAERNREVEQLVTLLRAADKKITCNSDGSEKFLNASEIYYAESVDKKTFLYCEKEIYRTEYRLYQLMELLDGLGFVQISKSCIININVLDSMKTLLNSRMEATLQNGERLNVNRKYLEGIKEKLRTEI